MLMKDKKKVASLIIAKANPHSSDSMKSEGEDYMEQETQQDDSVGFEAAAQELIDAVKSGSASSVVSALKSFIDMYESSEPPEME